MGPAHAFAGSILVRKSRRQKEFKWGKHRLSFTSYFKRWLVHVDNSVHMGRDAIG
jgi:hypothetical protein